MSRRSRKDKWPLGNARYGQPLGFMLHNRSNHSWDLLSSETPSNSGNYVNVVEKFKPEDAERTNGRWAMIGILALLGAYSITNQIIPGIY